MSLPILLNGADCGPSNPLQSLSKRFDQDRGLQQDYFGSSQTGSSRDASFRSQQPGTSGSSHDAAQFFSSPAPQLVKPSFDFGAFHGSLPQIAPPPALQQAQRPSAGGWAADFMQNPVSSARSPIVMGTAGVEAQVQAQAQAQAQAVREVSMHSVSYDAHRWGPSMLPMTQPAPMMFAQSSQPSTQHDQVSWDREFTSQESFLASQALTEVSEAQAARRVAQDEDELSRTAGLLLDTVGDVSNTKFQNSQFLDLMRRLRNREVVVEGNDMVENTGQVLADRLDVKGKGKAVNITTTTAASPSLVHGGMLGGAHAGSELHQGAAGPADMVQENAEDAYWRQENAEYQQYWNTQALQPEASTSHAEWDKLQADWDNFEATSSGIKAVDQYLFQPNNPFLTSSSRLTRHHLSHVTRESYLESVLELEAEVQRNMRDASAWFNLGVKQQANEREKQALQALSRAVELDPNHLPAWLALSISHTNNGDRMATYESIRHWVEANERYKSTVTAFRASNPAVADAPLPELFSSLIQCLIAMARSDQSGQIDADIQIALAVLLNTNEDYEKAQDCFKTALAVRPDDWLLYNRVGATMANSGQAEEAVQYYHRALELNPLYIRARFNLGISCINLRRFDEAVHHILDAIGLQESDGSSPLRVESGVTTTALWDSLRTVCMHLQRADLAIICDKRDLDAFRKSFSP